MSSTRKTNTPIIHETGNRLSEYPNDNQNVHVDDDNNSLSDEWSSSYTSKSSETPNDDYEDDDDDDDSFVPDWEQYINSDGNLFYIEYTLNTNGNNNESSTAAATSSNTTTTTSTTTTTTTNNNSNTTASSSTTNNNNLKSNEFTRVSSTRRSSKKSTGSKLSKLINRHQITNKLKSTDNDNRNSTNKIPSKILPILSTHSNISQSAASQIDTNNTKVKFSEITEGEIKEIPYFIDPATRHKFGRRATCSEAILGISICPFSDGQRIMIAGYMPNFPPPQVNQLQHHHHHHHHQNRHDLHHHHHPQDTSSNNNNNNISKSIKVGDWLKAINDQCVQYSTIDSVLMSFIEPTTIKLTLQRILNEEEIEHQQTVLHKITSITELLNDTIIVFNLNDLYYQKWQQMQQQQQPPQQHHHHHHSHNQSTLHFNLQQHYHQRQQQILHSQTYYDDLHYDYHQLLHFENDMIFSIMYLTMDALDENGIEGQDVLFCYPPKEYNSLYLSRGSFLTLNSILNTTFRANPIVTTVEIKGIDYHITYTNCNQDLLLIGMSSKYATVQEVKLKTIEFQRFFEFKYQTLPLTFVPKNVNDLQLIFMINRNLYLYLNQNDTIAKKKTINGSNESNENVTMVIKPNGNTYFESGRLEGHFVPLPKEAKSRIDEALGEMEAMDYREWNDEPLKSQREFFIIGSVLYFKQYLLANNLSAIDLLDVQSFLRVHGICKLLEKQLLILDMVIWHEIYPKSVERGLVQSDQIYGIPKGRWFLAIVARNHLLLAVILESKHYQNNNRTDTDDANNNNNNNVNVNDIITPSPFYIEEIQDTVEHLKVSGIENLANAWIHSNKRPQILTENLSLNDKQTNGMVMAGGITSATAAAATTTTTTAINNTTSSSTSNQHLVTNKKTEIISILKRRNNSQENVGGGGNNTSIINENNSGGSTVGNINIDLKHDRGGTSLGGSSSVNSQTFSEDSSNHKFDINTAAAAAAVAGATAISTIDHNKNVDGAVGGGGGGDDDHDGDDDSDSDWEAFPDSHRSSSGMFDMSDVTEALLKEVSDVMASKITFGKDNVLFHYCQLEYGKGILLAPPVGITSYNQIIDGYRRACLLIHETLQNTKRFRYLLSQENSKPNLHKSLVAIKEHGLLITTSTTQSNATNATTTDNDETNEEQFWVIGRLFNAPHKELYVCHRSNVPQNLIEIAFRLSMNSAG